MTRLLLLMCIVSMPALASDPVIHVTSTPPRADVRFNGELLGQTPLNVEVPPGKHVLQVTKEGYSVWKRKLKDPADDTTFEVELDDLELKAAKRKLAKKEAAYDNAELKLRKYQEAIARGPSTPIPAMQRELDKADAAMEIAAEQLEAAQKEFQAVQNSRMSEEEKRAEAKKVRAAMTAVRPKGYDTAEMGASAATPSGSSGPRTLYCAYRVVAMDRRKKNSASDGTQHTLTGCATVTAMGIGQAEAQCVSRAMARAAGSGEIQGTPTCVCAESVARLPADLAESCQ